MSLALFIIGFMFVLWQVGLFLMALVLLNQGKRVTMGVMPIVLGCIFIFLALV
jgi:hypothetical protein